MLLDRRTRRRDFSLDPERKITVKMVKIMMKMTIGARVPAA
jgi:hypothetical protein